MKMTYKPIIISSLFTEMSDQLSPMPVSISKTKTLTNSKMFSSPIYSALMYSVFIIGPESVVTFWFNSNLYSVPTKEYNLHFKYSLGNCWNSYSIITKSIAISTSDLARWIHFAVDNNYHLQLSYHLSCHPPVSYRRSTYSFDVLALQ